MFDVTFFQSVDRSECLYNAQYWACEQYRIWYSCYCKRSMRIYLAVLTEYCDVRHRGRWRDRWTACINSDGVVGYFVYCFRNCQI